MRLKYIMRQCVDEILTAVFWLVPVKKNKIVFDNFIGMGYGDNPKYVAEEIIKKKYPVQMVWLVNNIEEPMPRQIKKVRIDSVRAVYEKATAKMWIDNVRNAVQIKKRKSQIYLQVWHAPFGPKYAEMDAEDRLNQEYVQRAKYDGSITDAIIVSNNLQRQQFQRAFWLNDKVEYLEYGLPRNDVLFHPNICSINDLRQSLGIDKDDYVILYAPTFRDDYSIDGYKIEKQNIIRAFEKKLHRKCKMIIRLHPNVRNQSELMKYDENVIDGSGIIDTQYVTLISDCVISDYSTIVFDFAMFNKPVFICALDLERYKESRGLLSEFWKMPFPISTTNDELVRQIEQLEFDIYYEKVEEYFDRNPNYDDGSASARTVEWIVSKMEI